MNVSLFVDKLGREFAVLARTDDADAAVPAARLESVIRRTLFDVLAVAADEINRDLAPGSVELHLRGGEPHFVVTPPSPQGSPETAAGSGPPNAEEGATARISVPVSRHLKASIEQAAGREGRSPDAWLEQVLFAAVRHDRAPGADRRGRRGRQRYTAWVR
ncbi:hypothetical protein [Embleya sp. NPDC005575]|uniref:hypothetical protein n=1 Tax=Embleya sp. NPDC005575 TaxID=3156892 RepID=UPI0033B2BE29